MNRRAFLTSLLAAPVVASLPDIQRPRFSGATQDLGPLYAVGIDHGAGPDQQATVLCRIEDGRFELLGRRHGPA
jgi:hypothetical protein